MVLGGGTAGQESTLGPSPYAPAPSRGSASPAVRALGDASYDVGGRAPAALASSPAPAPAPLRRAERTRVTRVPPTAHAASTSSGPVIARPRK